MLSKSIRGTINYVKKRDWSLWLDPLMTLNFCVSDKGPKGFFFMTKEREGKWKDQGTNYGGNGSGTSILIFRPS